MTPYYDHDGITLYCGDMRDILPRLNMTFSACLTDPPYEETRLAWDKWPDGWPALVAAVTKNLWCFGTLRMFVNKKEEFNDWTIAQDLVWEKHNGSGMKNDRFRRVHESAVQFYQGAWEDIYFAEPKEVVIETRRRERLLRQTKPKHWNQVGQGVGYDYDGTRLIRSVIYAKSCHGYAVNETQKPLCIVAPLLAYSVPQTARFWIASQAAARRW